MDVHGENNSTLGDSIRLLNVTSVEPRDMQNISIILSS